MATPTLKPPSATAGGGAPTATPPRKNRTPLVIVGVVIALICAGIFAITRGSHQVAVPATTPQPTQPGAITTTNTAPAVVVVTQPYAAGATASAVAGAPDTTAPGGTTTTEPFRLSPSELIDGGRLTTAGDARIRSLLSEASVYICHGDQAALAKAFAVTADTSGVKAAAGQGCSGLVMTSYYAYQYDMAVIFLQLGVTKESIATDGTSTKTSGFIRLNLIPDRATGSWMLGDYPTLMTPTA